jgi:hypothetical protein
MISKAGSIKMLRVLAIGCAIAMGFMTLVGTSEDDVTDALNIDDDFDKTVNVELDEVTTTEADINVGASLQPLAGNNCGTLTLNQVLADLEARGDIDDLGKLDISSVTLQDVKGKYTAEWTPDTLASISCKLNISGTQNTTIAGTAINGADGDIDGTLTQPQLDVINYYLENKDEAFDYCVVCDAGPDTYTVTYDVVIGIRIQGDVDL